MKGVGKGFRNPLLRATDEEFVFSKRGLSGVVTTLIIVLLVIVAIGIIWVVVKGVIQRGADQIEIGQFSLGLEIKAVQIQGDNVNVTVLVKRNAGQGEFTGLNFIFSDGKNSETIRQDTTLKELEEKGYTFTLTKINASQLKTVSIAPIYKLSSGKESAGNILDNFDIKGNRSTGGNTSVISSPPPVNNFKALGYEGTGQRFYNFSSNTTSPIKFSSATVDPLDVLPGQNQTFTVHVYSPNGITNVTSVTELDNTTLLLNFNRTGADPHNASVDIWTAMWIVNDTHAIEYRTHITATDTLANTNLVTLTWTDSCLSIITQGTDEHIDQDCTTGTNVEGVDGGNLVVDSGRTLQIDSGGTWAFNSGKSITVSGTITVNGQISKTNLYYYDADNDGYADNGTLRLASSTLRGKDSSGTDCDPGWACRRVSYTAAGGIDSDNDGYGSGIAPVTGCQGSTQVINGFSFTTYSSANSGCVYDILIPSSLGTDCNDGNSAVQYTGYADADSDGAYSSSSTACNNGPASPGDDCNDGDSGAQYNGYAPDDDGDGWGTSFGCNNGLGSGPDSCPEDPGHHDSGTCE